VGEALTNEADAHAYYCQEAAIRHEGFPCRADIDCATPDSTDEFFTDPETGETGDLRCAMESMQCTVQQPAMPSVGDPCVGAPSPDEYPSLSFVADCESGACVVPGGKTSGVCSKACAEDVDCTDGWRCGGAIDQRYTEWSKALSVVRPDYLPVVRVCMPN
jgi:hypothetical protein